MKPSSRNVRPRNRRQAGARVERRAAWHYRLRGYRIVGRNVRAAGYEVDLIVRRGNQLVFCEVKAKGGPAFGDPFEMVDAEKQRRLREAASAWLAARPDFGRLEIRFDVVGEHAGTLKRLANAF